LVKRLKKKATDEYRMAYKDLQKMTISYRQNKEINESSLLYLAAQLYFFIVALSEKSMSYKIFLRDRRDLLETYERQRTWVDGDVAEEELVAMSFFENHLKSIDYLDEAYELKTVYFVKRPECFYLTDRSRNLFFEDVEPENAYTKLNYFMSSLDNLCREMNFNYKFFTKHQYLRKLGTNYRVFEGVALALALVQSCFMGYMYQMDSTANDVVGGYRHIVRGLAFAQIFMSSVLIGGWLNVRYYLECRMQQKKFMAMNLAKKHMNYWDRFIVFFVRSFLIQAEVRAFLFHILCASAGLTISEVFFSIELLIIANYSQDLIQVIRAVTKHSEQLLLTGILGVILVVIYSNITFYYFSQYFKPVETIRSSKGDEDLCHSLLSCFLFTLNYGFRKGGGLGDGDIALAETYRNTSVYFEKVAFNVGFFFIMDIIFLNLIFGIIVDTFGELRDKTTKLDDDFENYCFICNLDRWVIHREGEEFDEHKKYHSVWSYVYYYFYLTKLTEKDMDGVELYIWNKFSKNDLTIFPIHRSRKYGNCFPLVRHSR
jgi:inositol 1,4,5-triphosphate receptor type 3